MDAESKNLFLEISRGIRLIFDNAEQLYREGVLLAKNNCLSRAVFAHQISLEECGKIDIAGAWLTGLLIGQKVDLSKMSSAFRSHKAKNYANAYFATLTPEERNAREQKDFKGALKAFKEFQAKFHNEMNTAKNASLYVDFEDGKFSAPSDVITQESVTVMAAINAYFLELAGPKVRVLDNMDANMAVFESWTDWFVKRSTELQKSMPTDPVGAHKKVFDEMFERFKQELTANKSK